MSNGIGIDFGATAWRAAVCEDGPCRAAPASVFVPGGRAGFTYDSDRPLPVQPDNPKAGSVPRWLRLETVKAHLGTGQRLRDAKGHATDSFEAQAQAQLQALRAHLEDYLHADIVGAAVGVPACYGMNQRAALRSVAEAAGFGNVTLIDEPVAAALSFYQGHPEPRHVLIYCLGRSVFAASVLSVGNGAPQALNHEGSTQLGGQDFEAMLVQWAAQWMLQEQEVNICYDRAAMRQLIERAEQVKIALTTASREVLEIGPGKDLTGRTFQERLPVSRDNLETLIAPLVAQTIFLSQKAIEGAGLQPEDLAEILLVGEATYTPLVVKEISRTFGRPTSHAPPDAVACGAALYAASLHNCFVPRTGPTPAGEIVTRAPEPVREPVAAAKAEPGPPVPLAREPEDDLLAALRKARQTQQTGDLEAVIAAFEDLLNQAREELSYLYSKRSSELRQEGRMEAAQAKLERGLEHWPGNTHIRRRLAEIYADKARELARQQAYAHCQKHLQKSLELDPENASARQLAQELERVLGRRGKRPPGKRGKR